MDQGIRAELGGERTAAADLLNALNHALRSEHGPAEERLRRAAELLRSAGEFLSGPKGVTRGGLAPWQLRRVKEHIELNLQNSIRNDQLAAIARLTTCHFGRSFRRSLGEPPHAYIIRCRMVRAQTLMLTTAAPLSRIALECGLADQSHFSRLFKRIVGESPREWRRARMIWASM